MHTHTASFHARASFHVHVVLMSYVTHYRPWWKSASPWVRNSGRCVCATCDSCSSRVRRAGFSAPEHRTSGAGIEFTNEWALLFVIVCRGIAWAAYTLGAVIARLPMVHHGRGEKLRVWLGSPPSPLHGYWTDGAHTVGVLFGSPRPARSP